MPAANYTALLDAVRDALVAAAPGRVVTRTYCDFANREADELRAGIYTIVATGVREYPYERADFGGGEGGARQTDLGLFTFTVIGQFQLAEDATGEAVEAAEFEMLAELEAVADLAIASEELVDLRIERAGFSGQLDAPFGGVATDWTIRLL